MEQTRWAFIVRNSTQALNISVIADHIRSYKWLVVRGHRTQLVNWYLLLEGKSTIFIRVKESDKAVCLWLRCCEDALITKEVKHFERADKCVPVPIESLESWVRGEVANGAETLTGNLKALFTITYSNDKVLEPALGFITKTHDVFYRNKNYWVSGQLLTILTIIADICLTYKFILEVKFLLLSFFRNDK